MTIKEQNLEWRKSRLAARLLLAKSKRGLSARRQLLARQLAVDKGVTNRLIKHALASLYVRFPHDISLD